MNHPSLALIGAGIATDGYSDIHELARSLPADPRLTVFLNRATLIDPALLAPHDALIQSALAALHQAVTMAAISIQDTTFSMQNSALLVITQWGMIDATVAYLDSMLEADGRYASPRHFTRSVYSAPASALAIHFQIHGPCQTLAFDPSENPVQGALAQAARLLAAKRADHVAIVWADQAGPIATDLLARAAKQFPSHSFHQYLGGNLGYGATALIFTSPPNANAISTFKLPPVFPTRTQPNRGKPFPMDAAILLLTDLLQLRTDFRL